MASSLVKIDVHLIFHIKSTSVTIREADLVSLFSYVAGVIKRIGGRPFSIGGVRDHIHILASLPKTMSIVEFVRVLKIDSSKWLKGLDASYNQFAWQDGYGAFSVSPSVINKTMTYIQNQALHHERKTFKEEYKAFLIASGVTFDERYAFDD